MSSRLPVVSGAEVVGVLSRLGFVQVAQKGSHLKLRKRRGDPA